MKKTINVIISILILLSLALALSGMSNMFIFIAMALHAGQMVWLYGREWVTEEEEEEAPEHTWTKPNYEKPKGDKMQER
jgi:hypothetical protein